ncbi:MAG: hypothetical protein IPN13_16385 [Bacteroidetes bacterium]|nr:hypothetical protein [Bacteroidota bacterium]
MKTFNSTFVIIFTFIASISFTSCEKGDTGAPGPQGPIGPPGNVNVISKTVTVSSGDWISYSNPLGGNMKGSQKAVPEITSSIVSTGAVMVYLRQSYNTGGYYYQALPFNRVVDSNNMRSYHFSISTNLLNLFIEETDNNIGSLGSYTYKVVIIPANRMAENPDVNLLNYDEVKASFNLVE